jgi:hypothetical protein
MNKEFHEKYDELKKIYAIVCNKEISDDELHTIAEKIKSAEFKLGSDIVDRDERNVQALTAAKVEIMNNIMPYSSIPESDTFYKDFNAGLIRALNIIDNILLKEEQPPQIKKRLKDQEFSRNSAR